MQMICMRDLHQLGSVARPLPPGWGESNSHVVSLLIMLKLVNNKVHCGFGWRGCSYWWPSIPIIFIWNDFQTWLVLEPLLYCGVPTFYGFLLANVRVPWIWHWIRPSESWTHTGTVSARLNFAHTPIYFSELICWNDQHPFGHLIVLI